MASTLFSPQQRPIIERAVMDHLNSVEDYLSQTVVEDTRAVGGAIQKQIADNFAQIVAQYSTRYIKDFSRRAMADFAFDDAQGFHYVVDVKTYRMDVAFSMPNLVSVERLARFYQDDHNYFVLLLVSYEIVGVQAVIKSVQLVPIEYVGWDCLTIGALGWGQIQIAKSSMVTINEDYPRKDWMLQLSDKLLMFYPKEIAKIGERVAYFQKIKEYWTQQ